MITKKLALFTPYETILKEFYVAATCCPDEYYRVSDWVEVDFPIRSELEIIDDKIQESLRLIAKKDAEIKLIMENLK